MIRILLVVIAFILYGSLYPWQYRAGPPGVSAMHVLLHSWPAAAIGRGDMGDIAVNLILYVPVGMFAFLAFDRSRRRYLRWFGPVLLAFALSASIEMAQVYDQTRFCSLLDLLNNTLGGVIGTALGFLFRKSLSNGVFLTFHWLGFQLCAFLGLLAGRRAWPASRLETVTIVIAWFLVAYLLLQPAPGRSRNRFAVWLAAGFMGLLLIRGLAPFHFQPHPNSFGWVPFFALLNTEWIVGLPIFLEKAFYYGAAIWLLRQSGLAIGYGTLAIASMLAAIEALQRYLPGRTPESTDPLLAVVLGLMLWWIEQDYERIKRFAILQVRT